MISDRSPTAVCIFCGSKEGASPAYREAAVELGRALASFGCALVFGGAAHGLMGAVADGVLADGRAEAIGVIPRGLDDEKFAHPRLTARHLVGTLQERKQLMAQLSGAFVALPGGFGTMDELFEMLTWSQLGLHRKPIGLLNTEGYFTPMLAWVERAVSEGFAPRPVAQSLIVEAEPRPLLLRLLSG